MHIHFYVWVSYRYEYAGFIENIFINLPIENAVFKIFDFCYVYVY